MSASTNRFISDAMLCDASCSVTTTTLGDTPHNAPKNVPVLMHDDEVKVRQVLGPRDQQVEQLEHYAASALLRSMMYTIFFDSMASSTDWLAATPTSGGTGRG